MGFVERVDVEGNGIFFKYFVNKPMKHEWETPSDRDEVKFDIEVVQEEKVLYAKKDWDTNMLDEDLTCSIYKIISSFKREEESIVEVKSTFLPEHDQVLIKKFDESKEYDQSKPVFLGLK